MIRECHSQLLRCLESVARLPRGSHRHPARSLRRSTPATALLSRAFRDVQVAASNAYGYCPRRMSSSRRRTRSTSFISKSSTDARPSGVNPLMVPFVATTKCSLHICCLGWKSATTCPVWGSTDAMFGPFFELQRMQLKHEVLSLVRSTMLPTDNVIDLMRQNRCRLR